MSRFLPLLLMLVPLLADAAAFTSFGSSNASRCYEESLSPSSSYGLQYCNMAIRRDDLRLRELAATHSNRGIILAANGRFDEALKDQNQAVLLSPETGKVYINRGNLYFRTHEYEKAIEDYDYAIELGNVPMVTAWYNRAIILIEMKRWDDAIASLQNAIAINPDSGKVRRKLAQLGIEVDATTEGSLEEVSH